MKRNIIAAICVILSVTFIFVGCSKKNVIKDDYGKTHIAYTDENGETVTNGYGDVYVLSTNELGSTKIDENGEPVTVEARHRNVSINEAGDKIEANSFTFTVPEGWKVRTDITSHILLEPEDVNNTAFFEIFCEYGEDIETVKETARQTQDGFVEGVDETAEDEEEEVAIESLGISSATKYTFIGTKAVDETNYEVKLCCYVFQKGDYIYTLYCGAKSLADFDKADFDSAISSITFTK